MKVRFPVAVACGVVLVIACGVALIVHAESKNNKVALSSSPKGVSYVLAQASTYRPSHTHIGTIRPWVEANVGPQFVAAYVDTVLVRPGADVKRNAVLATLDCRNANAATLAISSQARAIDARQKAIADEAARKRGLLDGGFIAENDVIQALSRSDAESAQLSAQLASLAQSSLQVSDCILRAPFDGEVASRFMDPGAFARPGTTVVNVVDRSTVRITADVPESDFDYVGPGTSAKIRIVSTGRDLVASISRRAPSADPGTRTIHIEIDVPDADRSLPVNTTAEVRVDVGQPIPATELPIAAATIQNGKAVFFVVDGSAAGGTSQAPSDGSAAGGTSQAPSDGSAAHLRVAPLLGEIGGSFFVSPADLPPNAKVVTEGRELLNDNDHVTGKEAK
jgi:RND family efflux transporter MFP subunit